MYHFEYVNKSSPELRAAYQNLQNLLLALHKDLKRNCALKFSEEYVGSFPRHMVTFDPTTTKGFDFDVDLFPEDTESYSPGELRTMIRTAMGRLAKKYKYEDPEDGTRVVTMKVLDRVHSRINYSVDFCIKRVHPFNSERDQYIHFDKSSKNSEWKCQAKDELYLEDKIARLKEDQLWNEVRNRYLQKKNTNSDSNLHSRQIFSMTINEIWMQNGYTDEDIEKDDLQPDVAFDVLRVAHYSSGKWYLD